MKTDFWIIFLESPEGFPQGRVFRHNPIADYRGYKDFIGMKKITVDLERLEK